MPSLVVDFVKEKEEGYKRIFSRSPLLSSVSTQWDGILVAYDYLEPGQTPEISVKQHGIGIFVEMPKPAQAERLIDGQFRREQVLQGDVVIVPANTWHRTSWNRAGGAIVVGLEPKEFARTIDETIERDRIYVCVNDVAQEVGL
jgi:AraC family transcriptional regulator